MSAKMHLLVLGSGVVGVTSAYYLTQAGHRVTVVDRANHVAAGASYANGAQLSYSFTDALANPAFLSKLPRYILGIDPAVVISYPFHPCLLKWAGKFITQCTTKRAQENSRAALMLALKSSALLQLLLEDVTLDFSFRRAGKLVLVRSQKTLDKAGKNCEIKRQHGCDTRVLTMREAHVLEPQLEHMSDSYAGAVYSENDEVADARAFTEGLAHWLQENKSVTFSLGMDVKALAMTDGQVDGVRLTDRKISADAVVVCAGAWSEALLTPLKMTANIYPVRGYSVTLNPTVHSPDISITDYENKIVLSRIKEGIRIAGFADFVGFETQRDESRISQLLDIAKSVAPSAAHYTKDNPTRWGGLRPMTPDGQPRVGATRTKNLFLNTGHGMFGWTLACATGKAVSDSIKRHYNN